MTLLWFDGFESQDLNTHYAQAGAGNPLSAASNLLRLGTGIAVGTSTASSGAERILLRSITASAQAFAGGAFRSDGRVASGAVNYGTLTFYGDTGTTRHITIRANMTTHGIDIVRGTAAGTLLASSANGVWQDGAWYYLEASCTISDTVGSVEVRMHGSPTPIVSFSGDTKNAGTSTNIDAIGWGVGMQASSIGDRFDDIYVCNALGSAPHNTFLGDVKVVTSFPTGAGSTTGLTPSTGSNWQTVDEAPASATDYSGSATAAARDTYAMTDLPSGVAAVYGVMLHSYMLKSDAGAKSMKPSIRVGSTNYYGTTQVLGTSMTRYADLWALSPDTGVAWTTSEVNSMEIGAEVI